MKSGVENVIISSSDLLPGDKELIFQNEEVYCTETTDLPTLLVELGVYESKSKAKQTGRVGPIPNGYSELKASKVRRLYIWNPRNVFLELEFPFPCKQKEIDCIWRGHHKECTRPECKPSSGK